MPFKIPVITATDANAIDFTATRRLAKIHNTEDGIAH